MQRGLRNVTRSISIAHPYNSLVGPSRIPRIHVQARYATSYNPFGWLREKLSPTQRETETKEELSAAKRNAKEEGQLNLFDQPGPVVSRTDKAAEKKKEGVLKVKKTRKPHTSHKYSTTYFKISPRKLNMLGNQIAGKPIDYAILQMQFSEKRASKRIMNMLATARDHAERYKHLDQSKLVVSQAWVNKGKVDKRVEPRGRGHVGIRKHKRAKMHVVLEEGLTIEERKAKERAYKLNKVISAAAVREDKPIRNPGSMWAW